MFRPRVPQCSGRGFLSVLFRPRVPQCLVQAKGSSVSCSPGCNAVAAASPTQQLYSLPFGHCNERSLVKAKHQQTIGASRPTSTLHLIGLGLMIRAVIDSEARTATRRAGRHATWFLFFSILFFITVFSKGKCACLNCGAYLKLFIGYYKRICLL